jgi:hypothetical protein
VEWFRVGVGSSKWHRHEKFKHPWVFEQNHSPIPFNELPPRIHQKLKQTNRSNTIRTHRSREWKGSAMVLDRQNGIDKKNSDIWVF